MTTAGNTPRLVESDGADLWVPNAGGPVYGVRASDGKLLETWTGATGAYGVLAAKGLIFVTGQTNPGKLYQIDPHPTCGCGHDGDQRSWEFGHRNNFRRSANLDGELFGTASIVTLNPFSVSTVTAGFTQPIGILYDGANMWVSDTSGKLFKLD